MAANEKKNEIPKSKNKTSVKAGNEIKQKTNKVELGGNNEKDEIDINKKERKSRKKVDKNQTEKVCSIH